jgi:hypothetical protein
MKAIYKVALTILASVALFASATSDADAQQEGRTLKQQLLGTWTLVSASNVRPDGSRFEPFGSDPKGMLMLDSQGRFSAQLLRSDLPKFASNNRLEGTPEENKATVQGSVCYFGTYSVNEADHTLALHIVGSSFANWKGADQIRPFEIVGNQLKITNPAASPGGRALVVWERAK